MEIIQETLDDKTLPQMATMLDRSAMQNIWQRTLFGTSTDRFQVHDCQIERVKYKPNKNCLVCYRLTVADSLTSAEAEQILCARTYETGGSLSRYTKAHQQPLAIPIFGRPLIHLPELETVAWVFPNDRKLDGLTKLMDANILQHKLLPAVIADHYGPDWDIADMAHKLVHYVPEHTCIIRVQLQLRQGHTGEEQQLVLYGKTYYNQDGAKAYRNMHQLWQTEARQRGDLHIARPLAYEAGLKLLWQQGLPGQTLLEHDVNSPPYLTLLRRAANVVATLHRSSIDGMQSVTLDDWLAKLTEMKILLPQVSFHTPTFIACLIDRLIAQAAYLGPQPTATLHGDLHLKNFLVDGEHVALIDLDSLRTGSPWQDIGSFVAGIIYRGLVEDQPSLVTEDIIDNFTRAYTQNIPWELQENVLNWYIATALINERAFRCVTRLKTGRLGILDELITQADQISRDFSYVI